ncbi:MAG TPA: transcriptional regulator [Candidatus Marinimicrobia bacterium]|nr:transcriptional regulator [Candidatus Neomarinimicrobiota bacterium]HIB60738.1 transcriptional regulator [Candidatus Neomarinimicrobiota bacterium]HIN26832.1 transcriptional regulator [Candidatus Neomarinimicrobiota bacterium]
MPIITNLDVMLAKGKMTVSQLAEKIGITLPNLSRLKQGNVKGIRYGTLEKICEVLNCKPGDILDYEPDKK